MRRLTVTLVVVAALSGAPPALAGDDIVGSFVNTNQVVIFSIGSGSAAIEVTSGEVSLSTANPFCFPQAGMSCEYELNHVSIGTANITVNVAGLGNFLLESPSAVIDAPIPIVDTGFGVIIPAGTLVSVSAFSSGPDLDRTFRQSTLPLPEPLILSIDALSDVVLVDGVFPYSFNVEGVSVAGSVAGFLSADVPLANTAPLANAGADFGLTCPQSVDLSALGTLDKEVNATSFNWLIDNQFGLAGFDVTTPTLGEGVHVVDLTVSDALLGVGRDQVLIDVVDPVPEFTSFPDDIVTESCGALVTGTPTASSPCGPVDLVSDSPGTFAMGVHTITWTATSVTGKQSVRTQQVVVLPADDPACCPVGTNAILGTSNDDVLTGTPGSDCILAFGGQDQIQAGGGDDFIAGGHGDDWIDAGGGNDVVSGGTGQDSLQGLEGDDYLGGHDGDDDLFGGVGNDQLNGGQGQDLLVCGPGADRALGGTGDDQLFGEAGDDYLDGQENNDACTGGDGFDTLVRCVAEDDPESVGEPPFPGDSDYAACDCRPSKCNDCQSGVATCDATDGCPQILQCVQETSGCNLPHECSATCETGRFEAAIQAARSLASCFGGCD